MSYLQKNLAALAPHVPALATAIQSTEIPEGFAPTPGTDGTPTYFRVTTIDNKKRVEWLGATSMPAVSALPIVSSLDAYSGGANGLGLSSGTGFEWAAFVTRLGRPQMLYIYEPDLPRLRMALKICDLAELLAARRIVLLTGPADEAAQALVAFFAANLGCEPPTVLHPLPTMSGERRNQLLTAGEAVVRHAVLERQGVLGQWQERVQAALRHPAAPGPPRPLACLLTPRYAAERPIQDEAARRGARGVAIDQHDAAGVTLRLKLLAEELEQGAVCILSDLFRQQLAPIPAEVPVETWVPPLIGPAYWDRLPPTATFAPHDRIVVHFATHANRLQHHGIPPAQIILRPLKPDSKLKTRNAQPETRNSVRRVALIADLPASDEAALGIVLPTHQAVFAAACELIRADYLTVHPGMAPDILRRALARAGVDPKMDDPTLKEPMLRIVRDVLIPALPPLTLTGVLVREGLPLTLIGDWPGLQLPLADVRTVSLETYTLAVWDEVAVLAHLSPEGTFSPILWDAVAAQVAIAAPIHTTDRLAGALAKLLVPDTDFAHPQPQRFPDTIKALVRDGTRREKLAASAARHLLPVTAAR